MTLAAGCRSLVVALLLAASMLLGPPALLQPASAAATGDGFEVPAGEEEGWKTARMVGKFVNSDPPRPDQLFNVYYRAVNGKVESFSTTQGVEAKVIATTSSNRGLLEILFPRNFPYTNSGEGIGVFEVYDKSRDMVIGDTIRSTTDCFFVFSIPFEGTSEIELRWVYLLWLRPYHGDAVPEGCTSLTLVETTPEQLEECAALGIDAQDCTEQAILQKRARHAAISEEEMKRVEDRRNAVNNLMHMVGIGAAIAGAVAAFVTLRKRNLEA